MSKRESIHLASSHPPFDTRIFHKECKTLAAAGYKVTLIVPHERDEVVEGVRIKAVPLPASGRERLSQTLWAIYQAALEEPASAIFHFHDAELLPLMLLLKLRGRTVVYDMHEDTPRQVMYQHWIAPSLRKPVALIMQVLERLGGWFFDGLIVAEPVIARRFSGRKVVTVHNFPLRDELVQQEAQPYSERANRVIYVGSITEVRGIREVVQAMHLLPERLQAQLILGGAFHPATLEEDVAQLPGWARVTFLGWLERQAVTAHLAAARVGVVTFHPVERYLGNYPTKLFEYMVAGLPVVVSDFTQLRPFVEASQCGLLVDPLDPQAIAEAMQWLLDHPEEAEAMGKRGQEAIWKQYNWEQEAHKLLTFYEALSA